MLLALSEILGISNDALKYIEDKGAFTVLDPRLLHAGVAMYSITQRPSVPSPSVRVILGASDVRIKRENVDDHIDTLAVCHSTSIS